MPDKLSLYMSNATGEALARNFGTYALEEVRTLIDTINRANYNFPGRTFNLSYIDATVAYNSTGNIIDAFEVQNSLWATLGDQHGSGLPDSDIMQDKLYKEYILPFIKNFGSYYKAIQRLNDFLISWYASYQIVYYNEGQEGGLLS